MRIALRKVYSRYELPLMITENGLGAIDTMAPDGAIHDPTVLIISPSISKHCKQA